MRGAGGGGGGRRDDEGRIRRRTRDALRENARAISRHQGEIYALTVEIERRGGAKAEVGGREREGGALGVRTRGDARRARWRI